MSWGGVGYVFVGVGGYFVEVFVCWVYVLFVVCVIVVGVEGGFGDGDVVVWDWVVDEFEVWI